MLNIGFNKKSKFRNKGSAGGWLFTIQHSHKRRESGGRLPPHLVQNVENSGKQYFYLGTPVAKNCLNFSKDLFFVENTLIWTEKPSQFQWKPFFFGNTSISTQKPIDFLCKTQCIKSFFGQKFGPPQIISSSYANAIQRRWAQVR